MSGEDVSLSASAGLALPASLGETATFPYRLQAKVGEGNMGMVYRAVEPALGRSVAIKFLKLGSLGEGSSTTREMQLRFLQEARSAAAIQHPGAVTIYRVGQERGVAFLAMEWLEGETLAARLARLGALGVEEACELTLQALEALQAAHDAGVVHRDIKPANLMVLRDGRLKILDFGIARFRGADLLRTEIGVMLGTPAYSAPEQLRGEDVDARTDLYSLGTTLYEALTGQLPYRAGNLLELATKVLRESPLPIGSLRPNLPPLLEQLVARALAKDRAERWQSAREMAAGLRALAVSTAPAVSAALASPGWDGAGTLAMPQPQGGQVYRGAPSQLPLALVHLVSSWPAQNLAAQPVERLLARLLDKPLHTHAFSGGAAFGNRMLLLHDGQVLAAIDRRTGRCGDGVAAELSGELPAELYPVPDHLPRPTLAVLAGLLGKTRLRQGGLDSSIVHFPGLAAKLAAEQFDGVLHLRREGGEGRIVLVAGQAVLAFYSGAWEDVDLEQTWTHWAAQFPLSLAIEQVAAAPLELTFSLRLRDLEVVCQRAPGTGGTMKSGSLAARRLPMLSRRLEKPAETVTLLPAGDLEAGGDGWRESPAARVLAWLLGDGASHFADAKLAASWKYLAEWLPLVDRARLYADLTRPGSDHRVRFDVATFDASAKLLHLVRRFPRITAERFRQVVSDAVAEKEARMAGGDIGAVLLVAPEFPPEVIALYLETVESRSTGLRRLQENLTGYAGFVRVGPRRGFHLLLVEEGAGGFSPLDV